MDIHLDFNAPGTLTRQLIDQMKQLIEQRDLAPGAQLPTVRQLAGDLHVHFNTVARAYRRLHDEGVISTQQGRGTYVCFPSPAEKPSEFDLTAQANRFIWLASQHGYTLEEASATIQVVIDRMRKN